MRALALGALCGTLWLQTRTALPSSGNALLLVTGATLWLTLSFGLPWWRSRPQPGATSRAASLRFDAAPLVFPRLLALARLILIVFASAVLAAGWSAWRAGQRLADTLPPALEGRDLRLTGVVAGLADSVSGGLRFRFDVEQALLDGQSVAVPRQIALGWYPGDDPLPALLPGERWQLVARLKRPHGLANP